MEKVPLEIVSLHQDLPLPEYATTDSAGMDLLAAEATILKAGAWKIVPCGIKIALCAGYEAQIRPRSGLAAKHGVTILNAPGTIDADYRGEVCAILINHSDQDFPVTRGMRIAQMVIAPVVQCRLEVVSSLLGTARGSGGFGSTGLEGKA